MYIKALNPLKGAQQRRQEQLCDPLVPAGTYWYLSAAPELMALAGQRLRGAPGQPAMTAIAPTLQAFFTDRLIIQRHSSP